MSFFLEFISYFQVSDRVTWRKSWVLFSTVYASHYGEEEMILTIESKIALYITFVLRQQSEKNMVTHLAFSLSFSLHLQTKKWCCPYLGRGLPFQATQSKNSLTEIYYNGDSKSFQFHSKFSYHNSTSYQHDIQVHYF